MFFNIFQWILTHLKKGEVTKRHEQEVCVKNGCYGIVWYHISLRVLKKLSQLIKPSATKILFIYEIKSYLFIKENVATLFIKSNLFFVAKNFLGLIRSPSKIKIQSLSNFLILLRLYFILNTVILIIVNIVYVIMIIFNYY